jgi:glycosyltransferase involved in cell wall biosynthesis
MVAAHAMAGTWRHSVDVWVALSHAAKDIFIRGGIAADKIVVKPNFVDPDPGEGTGRGGYALFVGRLAEEKGVGTLVAAWKRLGGAVPLKIVGDGPLAREVEQLAASEPRVEWLGWRDREDVIGLMKEAALLVVPSLCRENFPLVVVEAYATGLPVIASDVGSLRELVRDGSTGSTFEPGSPDSLAGRVAALVFDRGRLSEAREAARAEYLARYTARRNYEQLVKIYALASGRLP